MTFREARGGVRVGAKEESEWIWENIVVVRGEINEVVTKDRSKLASNNP